MLSCLITGNFKRFKQVLAVGMRSSEPADCIQKLGVNSYNKKFHLLNLKGDK